MDCPSTKYRYLEWQGFQDPITKRVFSVAHEHNIPVAYHEILDDRSRQLVDSFPWHIEGSGGIKELTAKYKTNLMLQHMDPNRQSNADKLMQGDVNSSSALHIYLPRRRDSRESALCLETDRIVLPATMSPSSIPE